MKGIWCLAKPINFGVLRTLPTIKIKKYWRDFLVIFFTVPIWYHAYMNPAWIFGRIFWFYQENVIVFFVKFSATVTQMPICKKTKKINAHLIRRKMSINLLIELWKGFGVWQNPQISAFHRFYQTSRRRIYWRDLRVISFTVTIWYHAYMNPTWIFGRFPKIFFKRFLNFWSHILMVPFFGQKINAHF